tara:strand:- start:16 stop:378 length:363 start_codon:yes stop_codon:yes gene_type:complete
MKSAKLWEPKFIENSKIPVWLSKLAPIDIWAISFGVWVWCRGELSKTTRRHETIHFQQQLEMAFVFQWIAYGLFYLIGLVKYRDGETAYRENPFEREAYQNEKKYTYLEKRKRYAWIKFI